jgi:hypothetical protein
MRLLLSIRRQNLVHEWMVGTHFLQHSEVMGDEVDAPMLQVIGFGLLEPVEQHQGVSAANVEQGREGLREPGGKYASVAASAFWSSPSSRNAMATSLILPGRSFLSSITLLLTRPPGMTDSQYR